MHPDEDGHRESARRYMLARAEEKLEFIRRVHRGNGEKWPFGYAMAAAQIDAANNL